MRLTSALNAPKLACHFLIVRVGSTGGLIIPPHVPKEFIPHIIAFSLVFPFQEHEIGHLANARWSHLTNRGELLLLHELHERLGVLFLRQPDLINNHVVTPYP